MPLNSFITQMFILRYTLFSLYVKTPPSPPTPPTPLIWQPFVASSARQCNTLLTVWAPGMKTYEEMEVWLHSFLILALDRGEWSASCCGHFTQEIGVYEAGWSDTYCMIHNDVCNWHHIVTTGTDRRTCHAEQLAWMYCIKQHGSAVVGHTRNTENIFALYSW
jgi:hypothetical protein